MSHSLGMAIERLVAILLMLTIGYCMLLNKRLKRLKADEHSLKATIGELITATEIAERAIGGLKLHGARRQRESRQPAGGGDADVGPALRSSSPKATMWCGGCPRSRSPRVLRPSRKRPRRRAAKPSIGARRSPRRRRRSPSAEGPTALPHESRFVTSASFRSSWSRSSALPC